MLNLFGWISAANAAPDAGIAASYFASVAGQAGGASGPNAASGARWACLGPSLAAADGVVAIIRGEPIWGTGKAQHTNTPAPAQAVLEAYRKHGADFLKQLHGAFAVAIIDGNQRSAVLAVDRMGIERITYSLQDGALSFATSAEVVAKFPGRTARLRHQSLLDYLFFHMIPAPHTLFDGVSKIPAATAVIFRDGRIEQRRYWQPQFVETQAAPFDELKQQLHASLEQGVRAVHGETSIGAFLSGGLDSSSVAGFLSKVCGDKPAQTFSIGFGFAEYDELKFARIANARFGCQAHEYEVRPEDIVELFPKIARAYDEPFGNASALPTLCCARLAAESGVDHLLAGDGGDELFAGNKRYADQLVFERYFKLPRFFRRGMLEPMLRMVPEPLALWPVRKGRSYIAQANTPLPDRLESWNFIHRLGADAILHPDLATQVDPQGPLHHMQDVFESAPGNSLINKMLYYDWQFTLADNDLRKVGAMCELGGVRVSYPMLHPAVIDLSIKVPPHLKMRGTELRSFYKDAMRGFLPDEILGKTKHGFGLPFGLWLERSPPLADLISGNLERLRSRGLIKPEFLDKLSNLHSQEDASYYGVFVWTLAMLEQWLEEHRIAA